MFAYGAICSYFTGVQIKHRKSMKEMYETKMMCVDLDVRVVCVCMAK